MHVPGEKVGRGEGEQPSETSLPESRIILVASGILGKNSPLTLRYICLCQNGSEHFSSQSGLLPWKAVSFTIRMALARVPAAGHPLGQSPCRVSSLPLNDPCSLSSLRVLAQPQLLCD